MPIFSKRKTASDYIKRLADVLDLLDENDEEAFIQRLPDVDKYCLNLKDRLYNLEQSQRDSVDDETVAALLQYNLVRRILVAYPRFGFEARKDIMACFTHLLGHTGFVQHFVNHPHYLSLLLQHYQDSSLALHCGTFIREAIERSAYICEHLLTLSSVTLFFRYVNIESFDISSDAFATLHSLLTSHKDVTARFLTENYEAFFTGFNDLILAENYVIRRSSLRLLAELLLDRSSFSIMTKFIGQLSNLRIIMNLLLNRSRNIQYEAFHVFKIFVANPNKPDDISNVLSRNSQRLIKFLENFHCDGEDQLEEEVQLLIDEINTLSNEEQSESE
ncbi:hypothetical protein GEMRC1_006711 [Eukaryota sp. GEM-RC1]